MKRLLFSKVIFLHVFILMCTLMSTSLVNANSRVLTRKLVQQSMVEYTGNSFKAGTPLVLKPRINVVGGKFSSKRVSPGNGELVINNNTGKIDLGNSDPGVYEVVYKTQANTQIITLTLL